MLINNLEELETHAASRGGTVEVKTGMFNSRNVGVTLVLGDDEDPVFSSVSCSVMGVSRLDRAAQVIGVAVGWIDGVVADEEIPSSAELLSARCVLCDSPVMWENRGTLPPIAACPSCTPNIIADLRDEFADKVEKIIIDATKLLGASASEDEPLDEVISRLEDLSAAARDGMSAA